MSVQLEIPDTGITLEGEYTGPFTSCEIAKYIVNLPEGEVPTQLDISKLIRLVYISHGWLLGLTKGEILLVRQQEQAEAWELGPVYSRLHRKISHLWRKTEFPKLEDLQDELEGENLIEDGIETQLIRYVCKHYDKYDSWGLIELTSKSRSPWDISHSFASEFISNKLIADYYKHGLYQ